MSIDSLFENTDAITVEHNEVLEKILDYIQPVNFPELAHPKLAEWQKEADIILKTFGVKEDGSLKSIDDPEIKARFDKLNAMIEACKKLKESDYIVLIVENILSVAMENGLGICIHNGSVVLFNGAYWKEATPEQVKRFLGSAGEKMGYRKLDTKHYIFREKLYLQFVSEGAKIKTDFPADVVLINVKNGTYEITPKGGRLREFRESDFLTHQLGFAYNPTAKAPIFMKYLHECLPDAESRNILSEYLGYLFVRTSTFKIEKALMLFGSGANGKSVFFEVVNELLGEENVSNFGIPDLTHDKNYCRAKIATKLLNFASETGEGIDPDALKNIASGEPLPARLPYKEPFTMKNYAKLIFNANKFPQNAEQTHAYFRRFLIVPFDVTIPAEQQDTELSAKIYRDPVELAGVFNWILEGLDRLLAQKKFSPCKASDQALEKFKTESDSVKMFYDESGYEPSLSEHDFTPLQEVYREYKEYCSENGNKPVTKQNMRKRLEQRGITSEKKNVGKVLFMVNPTTDRF